VHSAGAAAAYLPDLLCVNVCAHPQQRLSIHRRLPWHAIAVLVSCLYLVLYLDMIHQRREHIWLHLVDRRRRSVVVVRTDVAMFGGFCVGVAAAAPQGTSRATCCS
jgi:hypothetical protein